MLRLPSPDTVKDGTKSWYQDRIKTDLAASFRTRTYILFRSAVHSSQSFYPPRDCGRSFSQNAEEDAGESSVVLHNRRL